MSTAPIKAAFLDRDGVLNHDFSYIGRPEDFVLIEGVIEALRLLAHQDYHLVVVTNQSGIGRGYFSRIDYDLVTARMVHLLARDGIRLAAIMHCPHVPADRCNCRKPRPGMLLQGAAALGATLGASVMFGDKESDVSAGRQAGVGQVYLVGSAEAAQLSGADGHGPDLLTCVRAHLFGKSGGFSSTSA